MEIYGTISELQHEKLRIDTLKLCMSRELSVNLLAHFSVGDRVLVDYHYQTKQVKAVVKHGDAHCRPTMEGK